MKRKFKLFFVVAFFAMAMVVTSCEKDNGSSGGNGGGAVTNNSVVGTWMSDGYDDEVYKLKLETDGTGVLDYFWYDDYGNIHEGGSMPITYKMTGEDEGYIDAPDERCPFEVKGRVMYLFEDDEAVLILYKQ